MRAKLLFLAALGCLAFAAPSQAGWHGGGCYGGGGWHGGGYGYYGGGWRGGGYCGPGWGWGGWFPPIGIAVAPAPVYYQPAPVYYAQQPGPAYYSNGTDPVLAAAQNRLGKLGYYSGYVDGQYGPRTNRALVQYQSDYGLPITGRLDNRTRAALGV